MKKYAWQGNKVNMKMYDAAVINKINNNNSSFGSFFFVEMLVNQP